MKKSGAPVPLGDDEKGSQNVSPGCYGQQSIKYEDGKHRIDASHHSFCANGILL